MRVIDNVKYLTIGEVGIKIRRGIQTIKTWYEWAEKNGQLDKLPAHYKLDEKGTRYFKEQDVQTLIDFRDSIKYGQMADFSRKRWGKKYITE